jgi:hypothetical protein
MWDAITAPFTQAEAEYIAPIFGGKATRLGSLWVITIKRADGRGILIQKDSIKRYRAYKNIFKCPANETAEIWW